MAKCCPRVRVKCTRPAPTRVTQSWYELKSPVSKPRARQAVATISHEARCKVYLGGKVILKDARLGSNRIDKAVSRGLAQLQRRGCSPSDPIIPAVKKERSVRYSSAPSEVVDKLRARARGKRK